MFKMKRKLYYFKILKIIILINLCYFHIYNLIVVIKINVNINIYICLMEGQGQIPQGNPTSPIRRLWIV